MFITEQFSAAGTLSQGFLRAWVESFTDEFFDAVGCGDAICVWISL